MARALRSAARPIAVALLLTATVAGGAHAQQSAPQPQFGGETRVYDEKLLRLAEILGAIHFLRELCGNTDGMVWRERMGEILDAEGSSAARRVKFTRAFNAGYRGYSRTYTTCTTTARTTIARFLAEGTEISETLLRGQP